MANYAHHRSHQIRPVPRRTKHMHLPKLHHSVHTLAYGGLRKRCFLLRIGHCEPQSLHSSIESTDRFEKIVRHHDAERSSLCRLRHLNAFAQQNRPVR